MLDLIRSVLKEYLGYSVYRLYHNSVLSIDDCRNKPRMFQNDYLYSSDHSLASIDVASLAYLISMMYATMDELN